MVVHVPGIAAGDWAVDLALSFLSYGGRGNKCAAERYKKYSVCITGCPRRKGICAIVSPCQAAEIRKILAILRKI